MHDQRKLVYTLLVFNPVVQMTMLNDYAAEMLYNKLIVTWFVDKVIGNRRKDDKNPEQALLAEVYNLLGNSSYGKLIEAVEQQMTVKHIKSENALRKDLQLLVWF